MNNHSRSNTIQTGIIFLIGLCHCTKSEDGDYPIFKQPVGAVR
jgi:hypothetical protein